ncbi:unnamed protein product [Penicillium nalgiovense]|uniref:Endosomal/vacuolar adapter protein YPT35 n=1 Tax=Penicillium nalgiovense TaxID=60175 RepID=A0A9W4IQQ0_PENNA|nr:unnamed protein product [Penicillium nalgiovense]CAG7978195.1 unnamed protein product [Penicillium nalgiovense]CAG7984561.1 unnamed protein product [Penicillium nalgiovense]CAG7992695.1 unnamed protein product [Penicillium nalgiovense]CAG7993380.1 unnamed protein product [Penicillium nalgiovense]
MRLEWIFLILVVSDIGWTDCCSDEVCCLSPFCCPCPGLRACLADSWTWYRYSEFDDLRQRLVDSFPHARNALPALPPKSVIYKFRPKFLESRRVGLEYFLNCVLLNPEFSGSPIVKDFLFGRVC